MFPAVVRCYWSVEKLNHYKRYTCRWREDEHRHRRVNIAQNLALTCNALPAIIPFAAVDLFEICQRHPAKGILPILYAAPVR